MRKSLLATSDLSSRSKSAVWRAVQPARTLDARLGVLHVVEDDQPEARMREEMRSAEAFLEAQVGSFGKPKDCEFWVRIGAFGRILRSR